MANGQNRKRFATGAVLGAGVYYNYDTLSVLTLYLLSYLPQGVLPNITFDVEDIRAWPVEGMTIQKAIGYLYDVYSNMHHEESFTDTVVMMAKGRDVLNVNSGIWVAVIAAILLYLRSFVFAWGTRYSKTLLRTAKDLAGEKHTAEEEKKIAEKLPFLAKKYTKYIWHGLAYGTMFCWGLSILLRAPWSWMNNDYSFDPIALGWPHRNEINTDWALTTECHVFMVVQTAWYVHGLFENVLYDWTRDDIAIMMTHHIVAIILIYGAMFCDSHRIAMHVMVSLDVADISMYWCKMGHLQTSCCLTGDPLNGYKWYQWRLLFGLTLIWYMFRIVFFYQEIETMWRFHPLSTEPLWLGNFLKIQLAVMLGLQTIWGVLITKMVSTLCYHGVVDDIISGDLRSERVSTEQNEKLLEKVVAEEKGKMAGKKKTLSGLSPKNRKGLDFSDKDSPDSVDSGGSSTTVAPNSANDDETSFEEQDKKRK